MKRFKTEYSEKSITYWPTYEAGKIGIVFSSIIGTIFVATAIWTLLDNPSHGTQVITSVAIPVVVLVLCVVLRYLYRTVHIKIVVSDIGITYFKNNIPEEKFEWNDIDAIYFYRDPWYGRKSCRILLKKGSSPKRNKKNACDFVLPVYSVDEQKLLQLIPHHLQKNDPRLSW